jgi:hypothetical protein
MPSRTSICLRSDYAMRKGALSETQFWLPFLESVWLASAVRASLVSGYSAEAPRKRRNAGVVGNQLPARLVAATGFVGTAGAGGAPR